MNPQITVPSSSSGPPPGDLWPIRPHRVFWVLLVFTTALRLLFLAFGDWDLTFDEAYYWMWSRQLDWCYFSKGPGIALAIAASTALAGDTPLGVRLTAVMCSTATAVITFYWAWAFIGDARRALLVVMMMAAAPLLAAGSLIATIDAPLFLCWAAATAALWWALRYPGPLPWATLAATLAAGLACKFTMGFFLAGMAFLAVSSEPWLRRCRAFWLVFLIGPALGLAPIVYWNSQHDWITITHTTDKATTDADTARAHGTGSFLDRLTLDHLPETIAQQAGAISPVLYVGIALALVHLLRDARSQKPWGYHEHLGPRRAMFLMALIVPIFGFYALLALHRVIPANWPVVGYLGAMTAAAFYWGRPWSRFQCLTFWAAMTLGLAVQLPLLLGDSLYRIGLPTALRAAGLPFHPRYDITNRLHGWGDLGQAANRRADELQRRHPDHPVFFLTGHYSLAAWLGFYCDPRYMAFSVPNERPRNQFDIWQLAGRVPPLGATGLILYEPDKGPPPDLAIAFDSLEADPQDILIERHGEPLRRFSLLIGIGFRGWPAAPPPAPSPTPDQTPPPLPSRP